MCYVINMRKYGTTDCSSLTVIDIKSKYKVENCDYYICDSVCKQGVREEICPLFFSRKPPRKMIYIPRSK